MTRYRVKGRVSTRKSLDPESPDYLVWLDWTDGEELKGAPKHLEVGELVESGHLVPMKKVSDGEA